MKVVYSEPSPSRLHSLVFFQSVYLAHMKTHIKPIVIEILEGKNVLFEHFAINFFVPLPKKENPINDIPGNVFSKD